VLVTIFHQAIASTIGIECEEMVLQKGYSDPYITPEPLEALKQKRYIFQMQKPKKSYRSHLHFAVNRIFEASKNPNPSTP
jgi:hypothetical protein